MADDKPAPHDPMKDVWFVVGVLAVIVFFWVMAGGPGKTDLRGIFLNPPAPVGNGDAYGPQFATTTTVSAPDSVQGQVISPAN